MKTVLPHPNASSARPAALIAIAALTVVTLVIYFQVVNHAFVWDTNHIFGHEALRSLSIDNVFWMLANPVIGNWHPVTWLSHMIDYDLFGSAAGYHHLVNVAIHLANSIMAFFLVRQLCTLKSAQNATAIALVTALVFAVHPLRVESVAWVAARKDLLYSLFFMISIVYYLRSRVGERRAYVISIAAFIASLLSKSMAVTLPAILLILDVYLSLVPGFWQKITDVLKNRLVDKIPYLLLTVAVSLVTVLTQSDALGEDKFTLAQQLKIAAHNVLFYLEKFFSPVDLSPFYPFPSLAIVDGASYWLAGATLLVGVTLATLTLALRGVLLPLICWSIYLVSLLPASGIIHVGSAVSADRYTYLPHLSITVGLVAGFVLLVQKTPVVKPVVVGLAGFWLIGLTALSFQQVKFWISPVSVWSRVLQVNPDTAIAHRNISTAYYLQGEYELAVKHLEHLYQEGWPVTRELTAAYLAAGNCSAARGTFEKITPEGAEDAKDLAQVLESIDACAGND